MSVAPEKKQELREMSRREALRVVLAVLASYREKQASGRVAVDVRSGKAIWVKPVIADVEAPAEARDARQILKGFDQALREFQRRGTSGTVTLVVCEGRGVEVERVVELEKVRVG